jgi:uncharacterized protein (TIGR02145 family)
VVNGKTLPADQTTFSDTITSFTDATGAPGKFPAPPNEPPNEMGCMAGLVEDPSGVCVEPSIVGCTDNILDLGTVSFVPGDPVEIIGNGISQTWSRPVTATGCQKTTYDWGTFESITADCIWIQNYDGDLFNPCAAIRYASTLCPHPWRLPTAEDAMDLLDALGGNRTGGVDPTFVEQVLLPIWGTHLTGYYNKNVGYVRTGQTTWLILATAKIDWSDYQRVETAALYVNEGDNVDDPSHAGSYGVGGAWKESAWGVRCIKD